MTALKNEFSCGTLRGGGSINNTFKEAEHFWEACSKRYWPPIISTGMLYIYRTWNRFERRRTKCRDTIRMAAAILLRGARKQTSSLWICRVMRSYVQHTKGWTSLKQQTLTPSTCAAPYDNLLDIVYEYFVTSFLHLFSEVFNCSEKTYLVKWKSKSETSHTFSKTFHPLVLVDVNLDSFCPSQWIYNNT